MSSFICPKCQTPILDSPSKGYITGCNHYPLSEKTILSPNLKDKINHQELQELEAIKQESNKFLEPIKVKKITKKELIKWAKGGIKWYQKFIDDLENKK